SIHRADGTDPKFNTFPIVTEIAKLRAEKGQLMGYSTYADYSLEKTMAKNAKNVNNFLQSLIKEYAPKADAETREIEAYAQKSEGK
ncbi:UNVERIFIED_CONTAM: M3 family metallopeptidase, partial [Prevotella sp. 15_C9]